MLRMIRYLGLGALLAYFFDPENGRRRRALVRERISARFQSGSERVEEAAQSVSSEAQATKEKVAHRPETEKPQLDDVTLALKVETEIFRDDDVPKGQVNVNAENGKIVLRGEVEKPAMIKDLEKRAKKVQGVAEVENLLHTPGSAAPAK